MESSTSVSVCFDCLMKKVFIFSSTMRKETLDLTVLVRCCLHFINTFFPILGGIVNNSLRPEIPTWCDPEWKALMESCWASDPAERPSFSEISQRLRNMAAAINVK